MLREEREILAKAAAWFATETGAVPSRRSQFVSANQAIHALPPCAGCWASPPAATMRGSSGRLRHGPGRMSELTARIRAIHQCSRATYGAPRIHAGTMRGEASTVGCKRVARLMKAAGLRGVSRRTWMITTVRDRDARPAPDLVERNFTAAAPNCLWVADITYIPTWAGFLYLAVVLDAFSRSIVGWAMATHLRTELVLEALNMALGQRRPAAVIHHSDQGSQYTSLAFGKRCERGGRAAVDGFGRRLLRQRHVREFLRHPRMRTARPPSLQNSDRSAHGDLRIHRGLVQPSSPPFRARLSVAD